MANPFYVMHSLQVHEQTHFPLPNTWPHPYGPWRAVWCVPHPAVPKRMLILMGQSHAGEYTHQKAWLVAAESSHPLTYWYRQHLHFFLLGAQAHPPCTQPYFYKSSQLEQSRAHARQPGFKKPLRFAYKNVHGADTKCSSTAGASTDYSAARRGWIPSVWIRLHGLREADSPKFDYAGTDRAKALRKWRYQSKDLTYIILKLSARPVERSLHSAALRSLSRCPRLAQGPWTACSAWRTCCLHTCTLLYVGCTVCAF